MEKGDFLIAINECVMIDLGKSMITIGKTYEIVNTTRWDVIIINDEGRHHYFSKNRINEFFKLKSTL